MSTTEYIEQSPFFPTQALREPNHELWRPIFKHLRFGEVESAAPLVVIRTSLVTTGALRACESSLPITCQRLIWTGETRGKNPRALTPSGYRSVLRLMWAWYAEAPPPEWAQIVHAPAQSFALSVEEVGDYGCGGRGGLFFYESRWRKCVFPWCLRLEPRGEYLYEKELRTEARRANASLEWDIARSRPGLIRAMRGGDW